VCASAQDAATKAAERTGQTLSYLVVFGAGALIGFGFAGWIASFVIDDAREKLRQREREHAALRVELDGWKLSWSLISKNTGSL